MAYMQRGDVLFRAGSDQGAHGESVRVPYSREVPEVPGRRSADEFGTGRGQQMAPGSPMSRGGPLPLGMVYGGT